MDEVNYTTDRNYIENPKVKESLIIKKPKIKDIYNFS